MLQHLIFINPSLKTAHITSVEIILDVIIDFWKGFRFSTTSFAAIPLSALASASDKISEYQSFIWIARNIIQKYMDLLSDQIIAQTNAFMGASAHPIIRYINESVIKTAETIECLEQKQIKVYRTSHLKFDEFNTEVRQFYSRWLSALDGYIVQQGPWYRDVPFSTVLGHSSRTNTLINLAQSFCEVC
uniref:Uncharacterized protein n=1 Tax=Panagrolaimus sp. PS1159 TaxID=55785 RepID=A0AC35G9R6_9BILA